VIALNNAAGPRSLALGERVMLMKRIMVLMAVVALMVVMLGMTVAPAFAAGPSLSRCLILREHFVFPPPCLDL